MKRSGTGRRLSLAGLLAELASLHPSAADRGACDDALNAVLCEVTAFIEILFNSYKHGYGNKLVIRSFLICPSTCKIT